MQHAKRERKIERFVVKRYIVDACEVKADIWHIGEIVARNCESILAGIKQVQAADLRSDHHRPAAAAATDVDDALAGFGLGAVDQKIGDRPQQDILRRLPVRPALPAWSRA